MGEARKNFYDSRDVQSLLGLGSLRTAQMRIQAMNQELQEKGYWIERGRIPVLFFHEKYPFVKKVPS